MKKIIEGFRYDTEKAIEIGSYNNIGDGASSMNDFQYWEATLYKTPRAGKYFLAGYGGPMTRFSRRIDANSMSSGESIEVLTKQDAFDFAQRYLPVEVVESEFSDMIKDA